MMKQFVVLSVLLMSSNSFATLTTENCNYQKSKKVLGQLSQKTSQQLDRLTSVQTIANGNGVMRASRSANKLATVAKQKYEITKSFTQTKITLNQCIELNVYSLAERDAIEAQLDSIESTLATLDNSFKSVRQIVLDQALTR